MSDQSLASSSPAASPSRLQIALTVGFHIGTALAVTIINKSVLNTLPVPVMLLLCQSVMCIIFIGLGYSFRLCRPPKLDYTYIRAVAPLLAMKLIAQLSKTYCLLNVNASFYQIARGLLLPLTIMLSCTFLPGSKPSTWALLACLVTTAGFLMGVSGETVAQTSHLGIAWGVWSSLTTALETVVVKHLALKTNVLDMVYVTSLATIPVYALMVVLNGELRQTAALGLMHPVMVRFEKKVFVSGVFNFALSAAAYLQIRVTSPTTHMVSTAARGVLQSVLAVFFLGAERLTASRVKSMAVILTGTMLYTLIKNLERRSQSVRDQPGLPLHNRPGSATEEEGASLIEVKAMEGK
ncbi:hypothetical protein PV11_01814 [Exophiala sideris]|uniref:Sugar phosphate transporter domain-containing protein n=1 Tax=Exophiala sideris TaxID=1016849 RepID=A0A0D1YXB3_9EURO|nr:hypothetical protein PV11_01814 [Exophiala sideris]